MVHNARIPRIAAATGTAASMSPASARIRAMFLGGDKCATPAKPEIGGDQAAHRRGSGLDMACRGQRRLGTRMMEHCLLSWPLQRLLQSQLLSRCVLWRIAGRALTHWLHQKRDAAMTLLSWAGDVPFSVRACSRMHVNHELTARAQNDEQRPLAAADSSHCSELCAVLSSVPLQQRIGLMRKLSLELEPELRQGSRRDTPVDACSNVSGSHDLATGLVQSGVLTVLTEMLRECLRPAVAVQERAAEHLATEVQLQPPPFACKSKGVPIDLGHGAALHCAVSVTHAQLTTTTAVPAGSAAQNPCCGLQRGADTYLARLAGPVAHVHLPIGASGGEWGLSPASMPAAASLAGMRSTPSQPILAAGPLACHLVVTTTAVPSAPACDADDGSTLLMARCAADPRTPAAPQSVPGVPGDLSIERLTVIFSSLRLLQQMLQIGGTWRIETWHCLRGLRRRLPAVEAERAALLAGTHDTLHCILQQCTRVFEREPYSPPPYVARAAESMPSVLCAERLRLQLAQSALLALHAFRFTHGALSRRSVSCSPRFSRNPTQELVTQELGGAQVLAAVLAPGVVVVLTIGPGVLALEVAMTLLLAFVAARPPVPLWHVTDRPAAGLATRRS